MNNRIETVLEKEKISQPQLTNRETECLTWCALGKSSWEIGKILGLSEDTINYHVKHAMRKLDASSRIEAVAKAVKMELIEPWPDHPGGLSAFLLANGVPGLSSLPDILHAPLHRGGETSQIKETSIPTHDKETHNPEGLILPALSSTAHLLGDIFPPLLAIHFPNPVIEQANAQKGPLVPSHSHAEREQEKNPASLFQQSMESHQNLHDSSHSHFSPEASQKASNHIPSSHSLDANEGGNSILKGTNGNDEIRPSDIPSQQTIDLSSGGSSSDSSPGHDRVVIEHLPHTLIQIGGFDTSGKEADTIDIGAIFDNAHIAQDANLRASLVHIDNQGHLSITLGNNNYLIATIEGLTGNQIQEIDADLRGSYHTLIHVMHGPAVASPSPETSITASHQGEIHSFTFAGPSLAHLDLQAQEHHATSGL